MPIMYGIAAFAVLANGIDQVGVDPQIDKQYAIVKQGEHITPAASHSNTSGVCEESRSSNTSVSIRNDGQDGTAKSAQGTVASGQIAPPALPGSRQTIELPGTTVIVNGQLVAPSAPGLLIAPSMQTTPGQRAFSVPGFNAFGSDNLSRLKGMDRLVSVQFTNATAADVLKWLSKQNVNFVANVNKLPKSKITMNVSHVPLHEALETVAECLGGSWQVKGSTLIFQTGGMFHTMPFPSNNSGSYKSFVTRFGEMKGFDQMDPTQMKAFEKSMEKFKVDQKMMSEDFAKQFKDLKMDGKAFTYKMDPQQLEKLKALGMKDGKAFTYKMDPQQLEQLKALGMMKGGQNFNFQWDPKTLGEMKSWGDFKGFKKMKGFTFKKIDIEQFKKSLSNGQRELMKKQGYLKFSDLTEAQRGMLFDKPNAEMTGDFTFVFGSDDQKITIKSK